MNKQIITMLVAVLAVFLLASFAAADTKLEIESVDVTIDGSTDKNVGNQSTVDKEAKPESTVKVRVNVLNLFTDAEDMEIQDIVVLATFESIDDGDDFEEESDEFDLNADKDKRITLEFEIPLKVEEDSYSIMIEVEGEDENGTTHTAEYEVIVDIEKDRHDLVIYKSEFDFNDVKCGQDSNLRVRVVNLGTDDEDEVVLTIKNSQLGVDVREEFELESDPFDDENENTFYVNVPIGDDLVAGSYKFDAVVYYDTDKVDDRSSATLIVKECPKPEPAPEPEPEVEEEAEEENDSETTVIVQPPVTTPIVAPPPVQKSDNTMMWLIFGNLVVALAIIVLVVVLVRKKH